MEYYQSHMDLNNVMLLQSNYIGFVVHNIIKQCAFIHVGPDENLTMGYPNPLQVDSHSNRELEYECESNYTRLGHPMVKF